MIRLVDPAVDAEGQRVVCEVLAGGRLVQGPHVPAFESHLANAVGTQHAVALNSGTSALHMALLAVGVGPGDRVAVAAYSYPATANAVELCGATPVFVDVRRDTFNIDPARLRATATAAGAPLRAVVPVHTFGQCCEMTSISELARSLGAAVIEDAACALGARWAGRPAGAWGDAGCFSFHPRKAITTAEGGAVTTDDEGIADTVRALRNHGLAPDAPAPEFVRPGFNLRMTELQGALGAHQMTRLETVIERRRAVARYYDACLRGSGVGTPITLPDSDAVYQSYVVTLPRPAVADRAAIIEHMRGSGVEATIGTYAIPLLAYYSDRYGLTAADYPAAAEVFGRSLAIPLHEKLTESEQDRVVEALLAALDEVAPGARESER